MCSLPPPPWDHTPHWLSRTRCSLQDPHQWLCSQDLLLGSDLAAVWQGACTRPAQGLRSHVIGEGLIQLGVWVVCRLQDTCCVKSEDLIVSLWRGELNWLMQFVKAELWVVSVANQSYDWWSVEETCCLCVLGTVKVSTSEWESLSHLFLYVLSVCWVWGRGVC